MAERRQRSRRASRPGGAWRAAAAWRTPRILASAWSPSPASGSRRICAPRASSSGRSRSRRAPREAAQRALERATPFLRSAVGRALGLRVTPELRFEYDTTPDTRAASSAAATRCGDDEDDDEDDRDRHPARRQAGGADVRRGHPRAQGAARWRARSDTSARSIPFASGLLPLCLGEATKVARYLLLERKALHRHHPTRRRDRHPRSDRRAAIGDGSRARARPQAPWPRLRGALHRPAAAGAADVLGAQAGRGAALQARAARHRGRARGARRSRSSRSS